MKLEAGQTVWWADTIPSDETGPVDRWAVIQGTIHSVGPQHIRIHIPYHEPSIINLPAPVLFATRADALRAVYDEVYQAQQNQHRLYEGMLQDINAALAAGGRMTPMCEICGLPQYQGQGLPKQYCLRIQIQNTGMASETQCYRRGYERLGAVLEGLPGWLDRYLNDRIRGALNVEDAVKALRNQIHDMETPDA